LLREEVNSFAEYALIVAYFVSIINKHLVICVCFQFNTPVPFRVAKPKEPAKRSEGTGCCEAKTEGTVAKRNSQQQQN
jgi:hypothetical protein